jgi:hypothetical protein
MNVGRYAMTKTEAAASWIISKATPFFGLYVRTMARVPFLGRMAGLTNKALGRLLPRLSFLGYRRGASFENAVWNWEIFLTHIGADYDVETSSPQSRLYTIKSCPAGHCRPEHLDACNATMELDSSLVESSGARLMVDKRFPLDGVCVERIVPK